MNLIGTREDQKMEEGDVNQTQNKKESKQPFSEFKIDEVILVLFHLEGFEEFREEREVPYAMTPRGITKAVGITEEAPFNTLDMIEEKSLIEERVRPIIGLERERNVYFLTEEGKNKIYNIWDDIKDTKVHLKTKKEEKELPFKEVEKHISGRNPITKALRAMNEEKVIDLTCFEDEIEVFVGRNDELTRLKNHLKDVKESGTRTVLIEGEAGIGKTSLVSRLKPFAQERGFEFLAGTCQSQTSDPYLPFKEAFSEYIKGKKGGQHSESMAFIGTGEEELLEDKQLFDARKSETFYETTEAVKDIAENNPLVVFLDDLQWVDKGTLDILSYMDDRLEEVPVFFIGSYRPEEVDEHHHLMDMIHRLGRDAKIEKIELNPLSASDTEETIKGFLGVEDPPGYFVDNIHEKTDGNPLFIKEALRQMKEEGLIDPEQEKYPERGDDISVSDKVHNVIQRRIKQLDDDTMRVVEIGSVIGDKISFELLSKTSEIGEIDLLDHIDMLTGNQLWDEKTDEEVFFFSHEMIKTTVYDGLKPLKKRLLHKRIASNIEELFEDELEDWYSDLARHHERANEPSKALEYYIKAGEKAEGMFANEDAIEMYGKALELSEEVGGDELDRVKIIEKIATAYSLLGEYEDTREYLEKALDLVDENEKPKMYRKIALTHKEQGNSSSVIEYADKGISCQDEDSPETCRLLSLKGWAYMKIGEHEAAEGEFKKEQKLLRDIEDEKAKGQIYHDLGTLALRRGNLDEGIDKLKKAIELREKIEHKVELQKSYNNIGGAFAYKGDTEKGEEYFKSSLEVCEDIGHKHGTASSYHNLADMEMRKGNLREAIQKFEKSLEISKRLGDIQGEANVHTNLAEIYAEKGDLEKSEKHLEKSKVIREKMGDKYWTAVDLSINAAINLKKGRFKKAEEKILESIDISQEIGSQRRTSLNYLNLGELYHIRGDFDEAKKHYEQALKIAEAIGTQTIQGRILDGIGKTYLRLNDVNRSKDLHDQGLDLGEKIDDGEVIVLNLLGLAEDYLSIDEIVKADEYATKASEKVEKREEPKLNIRSKAIQGKISIKKNDLNDAEKLFNEALDQSKEANDKPWQAKIIFELGKMFLAKGEKEEAEKNIVQAVEMFEDMGMRYWKDEGKEVLNKCVVS